VREAKQGVESLFAVLRLQDAVACLAQDAVRDPTSVVLIVDDKHRDGRTGQRGVHRTQGDQENGPGRLPLSLFDHKSSCALSRSSQKAG
jgi:hypothetical protein